MSEKIIHVIDQRGYVLMGDSRGIIVPYALRTQVHAWAEENKIAVEYHGSMDGKDLWYVKDDEHRAWFLLRWS